MSTAGMAGRPGPVVSMPGFAADWKAAVEARRARVARYHVVGVKGVHPRNVWGRREDGLYDLSGSAWAFDDGQVQECPFTGVGRCACVLPDSVEAPAGPFMTLTRVKEGRSLVVKGVVRDALMTREGGVVSVRIVGYREDTGEPRDAWYAVDGDALAGSRVSEQRAVWDACGHVVNARECSAPVCEGTWVSSN